MNELTCVDSDVHPKHLLAVHNGSQHLLIDEVPSVEYGEQLLKEVVGVCLVSQSYELALVLLTDRHPGPLFLTFVHTKVTISSLHDLEEFCLDQLAEPLKLSLEIACLLTLAFGLFVVHKFLDVHRLGLQKRLHIGDRVLQLRHVVEDVGALTESSTCRLKRVDGGFEIPDIVLIGHRSNII